MDDGPILQQFVDSAAQEPFAHLVARHVHLVYSSCLRQLKDPTLADQATQATFVLLARNAARLTRQSSLVPFPSAAALAAFSAGAPIPANQMADAVAAAQRRERIISTAIILSLVLLLGVGALKLRSAIKNARLAAATQSTSQPGGGASGSNDADPPFVRPAPQLPPMPEKQIPAPKPDKPVDPALAARFIAAIRQSDADAVQQLV